MKNSIYLSLITLLCASKICTNQSVVTFISPRSQSTNVVRDVVGWHDKVNLAINNDISAGFALTPELTKTFRPERIAQCLFGDDIVDCKMTFTVSGSQIEQRKRTGWLADYFGLPTDFISKVRVKPRVSNAILDLQLFLNVDTYAQGLFFTIHAPLVYSRWNLNLQEEIIKPGSAAHEPGYFNPEGIPREQLLTSFLSFISGCEVPQADNLIFNNLRNARMNPCSQHAIKLSDIQPVLGWNMYNQDEYHLALMIRGAIPTGNRPEGNFLFEPLVGNGHFWELGAGISAHYVLWPEEEKVGQIAVYTYANFTHFFSTRQRRSFDLKNKPNSRYLLASRFENTIENNLRGLQNGIFTQPIAQFKREVTPIANLTTLDVDVSIRGQIDFALMLSYAQKNKTWVFGYNFWTRSCECITKRGQTPFDKEPSWAIKGDTRMFGFLSANSPPLNAGDPVALSASQNRVTINTGLNKRFSDTNERIDNPQQATAGNTNQILNNLPINGNPINTSIQPILLKTEDIDFESARTSGTSHKIFAHVNRYWPDRTQVFPFIGFGAEAEFGRKEGPTPQSQIRGCINCALSQWSVWVKGGWIY